MTPESREETDIGRVTLRKLCPTLTQILRSTLQKKANLVPTGGPLGSMHAMDGRCGGSYRIKDLRSTKSECSAWETNTSAIHSKVETQVLQVLHLSTYMTCSLLGSQFGDRGSTIL